MYCKKIDYFLKVSVAFSLLALCSCNNYVGSSDNINHTKLNNLQQKMLNEMPRPLQSNKLVRDTILHDKTLQDPGAEENPVRLGYGLDERTGMPKIASCMVNIKDPNAISFVNPSSSINFSATTSSSTIAQHMNVALSGKANFGLYSASVAAEYARSTIDTRRSVHFNYLGRYEATAVYNIPGVGNKILSADAQQALDTGGLNAFFNLCGNSVIDHAKRGALLAVDVSIEFANAASRNKFAEHVNVDAMGIGGIAQAFTNEKDKSTSGATLVVKALQLGGDTNKLARIFGKQGSDGNYNITDCVQGKESSCSKIINDIVCYAQTDFEPSIDYKNEQKSYTFTYGTTKFEELGIKAHLADLTKAEEEANQYLANTLSHDRIMLQYLQSYQKQTDLMVNIDAGTKDWLKQATIQYGNMIQEYNTYNLVNACYGDTNNIEQNCVVAAEKVKEMHQRYKTWIDFSEQMATTILEYAPEGYIFKYIPNTVGAGCTRSGDGYINCQGAFALYLAKSDKYHIIYECAFDTTMDSSYFRQHIPSQIDKTAVCWQHDEGSIYGYVEYSSYIKRKFLPSKGILGIYHAGATHPGGDFPVDASGYNDTLYFSDSSNFLYNPI